MTPEQGVRQETKSLPGVEGKPEGSPYPEGQASKQALRRGVDFISAGRTGSR
jgi:hypothetical protein